MISGQGRWLDDLVANMLAVHQEGLGMRVKHPLKRHLQHPCNCSPRKQKAQELADC